MAITKTRKLVRVEIIPQDGGLKPTVSFYYHYIIDDPDDDELPIVTQKTISVESITRIPNEEDGTVEEVPTDLTGHDPMVIAICNAVWAD